MYTRIAAMALLALLISSCSSLVTAYLINNYLNDKAPIHVWRGVVTDQENRGISGATVRIRATVVGDPNPVDFSGLTSDTGHYFVEFKYNAKVNYHLAVLIDEVVVAQRNVGAVGKGDQRDDFVVQSAVGAALEVSGVVRDANGDPIEDALVLAGSAATAGGELDLFVEGAATAFVQTGASGVFQLDGTASGEVVAVAFHPEHGFAYATGEDDDEDGDLALNLTMGAVGAHDVQVQVVDGLGTPVSSQVLDPSRQFRLRLRTPYDLSEAVNVVVADNSLYPGLLGDPSDLHPVPKLLSVQSTGENGIADASTTANGGTYLLDLLEIDSSQPATALVVSDNPLPLAGDATVIVRVN